MRIARVAWGVTVAAVLAWCAGTATVSGAASPAAGSSPGAAAPCPTPAPPAVPRPSAPLVMPEDVRLALLDAVWQGLSDNYIDPGMNGLDWPAIQADYAGRIIGTENAWEAYALLEEMVGLLHDPDTLFLSALALESAPTLDPTYGGIGVQLDTLAAAASGQGLRILDVFPGSPALAAGIAPRDRIVAVDGDPCPRPELVRGPVDTPVTLSIQSPGQAPRDVVVQRQRIAPVYAPEAGRLPGEPAIGTLRLPSLTGEEMPAAVEAALGELLAGGPLDGLVIDLRHTAQGAPGVTASVLGQFTGGAVASLVSHTGTTPYVIESGQLRDQLRDTPLVILVDAATDGEAERLAAILQSQHRATVVGQRTPGHTQLIQQVPLPEGSVLQMVVGGLVTADGTRVEGHGVEPDVTMTDDWLDQPAAADTWVQAAVEVLHGQDPGPVETGAPA
jgi:carboxyl-terminal processing protease